MFFLLRRFIFSSCLLFLLSSFDCHASVSTRFKISLSAAYTFTTDYLKIGYVHTDLDTEYSNGIPPLQRNFCLDKAPTKNYTHYSKHQGEDDFSIPPPNPPVVQSAVMYCQGSTAAPLSATTSAGGVLNWYGMNPVGGMASANAPTPITSTAGTINYYVSQTVDGLESPRASISIVVRPTPAPPTVNPVIYVQNTPAVPLTATGQNLRWYTIQSGGTAQSSVTPSTKSIGITSYYVTQTVEFCESSRASLQVTVKPPEVPFITITNISKTTLCAGNTFTVSFTATQATFSSENRFDLWLSDANGDFTNQTKIGSGLASPVTATLPNGYSAKPYGTNYHIKVVATQPVQESNISDSLTIGDLTAAQVNTARGQTIQTGGATICTEGTLTLYGSFYNSQFQLITPTLYKWQLNKEDLNTRNSSLQTGVTGSYRVIAQQGGCELTSDAFLVTTNSTISASFTSFDNAPQCEEHPLELVSLYFGDNASYQWKRDGQDITGATNYNYSATTSGFYSVEIKDGSCSTTTPLAYLRFGSSIRVDIMATDTILFPGEGRNIMLVPLGNTSYTSYEWRRNGELVSTNRYMFTSQEGEYILTARQSNCVSISNSLHIKGASVIPVSIKLIGNNSLCTGESRLLKALTVDGVTLQWQKDGVDIVGATGYEYTATTAGTYRVKVKNNYTDGLSEAVPILSSPKLRPTVSSIVEQQGCESKVEFLKVQNSEYYSAYTYQWKKDGIIIPNQTTGTLKPTGQGVYQVKQALGSCEGTSPEFFISAQAGSLAEPTVVVNSTRTVQCKDNVVWLECKNQDAGSAYQWKRNGSPLYAANGQHYYATESGNYTIEWTINGCHLESKPVEVKINEPIGATLSGNALISNGTSTLLPITFTGPAPWSFVLTNGQSVQTTYQNPYLLRVAPASTTTYQLASVGNSCGTGTTAGSALVTVASGSADVSLDMVVSNRTPKINEKVNVTLTLNNTGPQDAVGVQVRSLLPTGLSFMESNSPMVSFTDGTVNAHLGTLAVNESVKITFQAVATQPGTFVTAAQVTGTQTPDPDSQPNSGTEDGQDDAATVDFRKSDANGPIVASANPNQLPLPKVAPNQPPSNPATADLSLLAKLTTLTPKPNDVISLSLTVSNRGGSAASSVVVQTLLPSGWQVGDTNGFVVNGQTVRGYVNQLPAGQSVTLVLPIRVGNASALVQAQIQDMAEVDSDSTPGNGYTNGEDDEASISIRTH
jgi:uncharacterized repeat protein (TIGR01451 family)